MAALTVNSVPPTTKLPPGQNPVIMDYDLAANAIIYKGAFVKLGTTGITASTGTGRCLGYAIEGKIDNTGGAAGDKTAKIVLGDIIEHAVATVANAADIKKRVFASDDQTLTLVSTSNGFVGWVYQHVTSTTALVKMAGPAVPSA